MKILQVKEVLYAEYIKGKKLNNWILGNMFSIIKLNNSTRLH